MARSKITGFMLPTAAASSMEPQAIAGLIGLWTPGEARTADELGMAEEELLAAIDAGAPIVAVEAKDEKQLAKAAADADKGDGEE